MANPQVVENGRNVLVGAADRLHPPKPAEDQRRRTDALDLNRIQAATRPESGANTQSPRLLDVLQHGVAQLRQLRQKRDIMPQTVRHGLLDIRQTARADLRDNFPLHWYLLHYKPQRHPEILHLVRSEAGR